MAAYDDSHNRPYRMRSRRGLWTESKSVAVTNGPGRRIVSRRSASPAKFAGA